MEPKLGGKKVTKMGWLVVLFAIPPSIFLALAIVYGSDLLLAAFMVWTLVLLFGVKRVLLKEKNRRLRDR
jgi:hypothetical protein